MVSTSFGSRSALKIRLHTLRHSCITFGKTNPHVASATKSLSVHFILPIDDISPNFVPWYVYSDMVTPIQNDC